ncbi:variable surface lipoprotein [[Mycoplasma] anseris]|uniref:Uncharacterized protein n=1 Tax=[Mycoplasma] anseris TaxID=92400 RepID=A0A2Z4ND33_9BACT|nr:variable surface lipoprotein [[Mycoplasma] anseris]AWX69484.1 hypothetical protein DP065_01825 [[Mycoplasma] anseris]
MKKINKIILTGTILCSTTLPLIASKCTNNEKTEAEKIKEQKDFVIRNTLEKVLVVMKLNDNGIPKQEEKLLFSFSEEQKQDIIKKYIEFPASTLEEYIAKWEKHYIEVGKMFQEIVAKPAYEKNNEFAINNFHAYVSNKIAKNELSGNDEMYKKYIKLYNELQTHIQAKDISYHNLYILQQQLIGFVVQEFAQYILKSAHPSAN